MLIIRLHNLGWNFGSPWGKDLRRRRALYWLNPTLLLHKVDPDEDSFFGDQLDEQPLPCGEVNTVPIYVN